MNHDLKCWPEPFAATRDGRKTHEWRRDDRGFKVGDTLTLFEWDPSPTTIHPRAADQHGGYTGERVVVEVTFITRGQFGVPPDYCVMSTRVVGERCRDVVNLAGEKIGVVAPP